MSDDADEITSWDQLGYPKPANNLPTKAQIRDVYRAYWMPRMMPLLQAQEARALGLVHVQLRDEETGEWKRLTEPEEITRAMNALGTEKQTSMYRIYTKDPDGKDIQDVLNRCLDKPKEQEQEIDVKGTVQFSWKTEE